jgi:hypothetical protein
MIHGTCGAIAVLKSNSGLVGGNMLKRIVVLVAVAIFALTCSLCAFAAEKKPEKQTEKQTKQWFVLKDKNGKCSVHQEKAPTPTTIAGPFATKEEAVKAKEEKCPKPEKKGTEKKTIEKKAPEKKTP